MHAFLTDRKVGQSNTLVLQSQQWHLGQKVAAIRDIALFVVATYSGGFCQPYELRLQSLAICNLEVPGNSKCRFVMLLKGQFRDRCIRALC